MRHAHERILETAAEAGRRQTSRRGLLRGSAALAGGGALALAGIPAFSGLRSAAAQEFDFEEPVDVLNYALTLEHLENAFYRDGLANLQVADFEALGFLPGVVDYLAEISANEAVHVETLTSVITELGGEPVEEQVYDFGDAFDSAEAFLATAQALENTGVDAYTGAAQFLIEEDDLLTAALTIHGVEARHAAYLNVLNGESPFPDAFDEPLSPEEVLEIAGPFLGQGGDATPEGEDDATPDA
jgi:rubrerythrin